MKDATSIETLIRQKSDEQLRADLTQAFKPIHSIAATRVADNREAKHQKCQWNLKGEESREFDFEDCWRRMEEQLFSYLSQPRGDAAVRAFVQEVESLRGTLNDLAEQQTQQ